MKINIAGLDKAEVLAALFNATKSGDPVLDKLEKPMTKEEAEEILQQTYACDWVRGRPIKVVLSGDEFESTAYDCNNGESLAEKVINELRAKQQ